MKPRPKPLTLLEYYAFLEEHQRVVAHECHNPHCEQCNRRRARARLEHERMLASFGTL
jgi:hypothetical protein